MARSVSNRSETNIPFVQNGPIAPLNDPAVTNPAMGRFYMSRDEPLNQSIQSGLSQRLSNVQETTTTQVLDCGMDPAVFLDLWGKQQVAEPFVPSRPDVVPNELFMYQLPSGCPSMISGSSATEASPLTRQNSSVDNNNFSATEMGRFPSSQSQVDGFFPQESTFINAPLTGNKRPADRDLFGLGASLSPTVPEHYASSAPHSSSLLSSSDSTNMERSISSTSTTSVKSNASSLERRVKEARERAILNAKVTTLLPKAQDTNPKSGNDTTSSKKKARIPAKQAYVRPKQARAFCNMCKDHPEGFRGDHELRRHVSAKHEGIVKKWVCRDPATVNIKSGVTAINPLDKCKACVAGKEYGAYYNAAAHLRRTHFRPKTPRAKNKVDEKRGGKGGGDWPPMNDLKLWFVEKMVEVGRANASSSDEDDADEDMPEVDEELSQDSGNTSMGMFPNMSPFMGGNYDLTVDDNVSGNVGMMNPNVDMTTPISSASATFGFAYANNSPVTGLGSDYAFSEQDNSVYSSNMSSTNTITPSTYQDMSQMSMADGGMWPLEAPLMQ